MYTTQRRTYANLSIQCIQTLLYSNGKCEAVYMYLSFSKFINIKIASVLYISVREIVDL